MALAECRTRLLSKLVEIFTVGNKAVLNACLILYEFYLLEFILGSRFLLQFARVYLR